MTRLASKKLGKQLNKANDGLGNNKKREGIKDDIQKVIEAHNSLAKITQTNIDQIQTRIDDVSVVLQAIAQILGVEKVAEGSKQIRIKLLEDESAEQGENVAKALEEGKLSKAELVDEKCMVITSVKKSDGSPMYPSKSYLPFSFYKPEVQAVLKGKKVGDVMELPTDGGTIEILEIYVEVDPPTPGLTGSVPIPPVEDSIDSGVVKA